MSFLKAVAIIVPILVAGVGLIYTVRPGLKPCVGAEQAKFTGVPVFPRVHFRDHLFRSGVSQAEIRKEPDVLGAEVRFSYATEDLRGAKMPIMWSLVTIKKDNTLGPVVRGQDRVLAMLVTPDSCSESGGKDLFVQILEPKKRYRVVLELYRDRTLQDRLALEETPIFSG